MVTIAWAATDLGLETSAPQNARHWIGRRVPPNAGWPRAVRRRKGRVRLDAAPALPALR
jgi:hypothetical protein